jgi:type 1 glutamine amidotransferase
MAKFTEANIAWQAQLKKNLEMLSTESLKKYDAVIFANTTGDLPIPDRDAFINWVKEGHGFVGMHSASDTYHGFRPYIEMLGGEFQTHGAQVHVDAINQDPQCAACKHLSEKFGVFDEIYIIKSFDRSTVHGLLTLTAHPNNNTPGDFPIAWKKEFGKGRVFYTSLGHREDVWDDNTPANFKRQNSREIAQAYQQHILGGIKWALGLENCDAKPQTTK